MSFTKPERDHSKPQKRLVVYDQNDLVSKVLANRLVASLRETIICNEHPQDACAHDEFALMDVYDAMDNPMRGWDYIYVLPSATAVAHASEFMLKFYGKLAKKAKFGLCIVEYEGRKRICAEDNYHPDMIDVVPTRVAKFADLKGVIDNPKISNLKTWLTEEVREFCEGDVLVAGDFLRMDYTSQLIGDLFFTMRDRADIRAISDFERAIFQGFYENQFGIDGVAYTKHEFSMHLFSFSTNENKPNTFYMQFSKASKVKEPAFYLDAVKAKHPDVLVWEHNSNHEVSECLMHLRSKEVMDKVHQRLRKEDVESGTRSFPSIGVFDLEVDRKVIGH